MCLPLVQSLSPSLKILNMIRTLTIFFLLVSLLVACTRNALTGKNQATLLPESDLQAMSAQQYQQFLSSNKVVTTTGNKDLEMVKRVGERITKAAEALY